MYIRKKVTLMKGQITAVVQLVKNPPLNAYQFRLMKGAMRKAYVYEAVVGEIRQA